MSTHYKLALIGFGNVGQGFAQILAEKRALLKQTFDLDISIVAISDPIKGSVAHREGFDPNTLLTAIKRDGNLNAIDATNKDWNASETIAHSGADILVELSYTDLKTGEPALSHIKQALSRGMHISTTNKGPIALQFPQLQQLARQHHAHIGIEGTVLSGTPCLYLGESLRAAGIKSIQGILNGTTNFMLGKMSAGDSFSEALQQAQVLGYAEADPSNDIEGFDAAGKVAILANLFLNLPLTLADIERVSIETLDSNAMAEAKAAGKHWKLIGSVTRNENGYQASVKPQLLDADHPLAQIGGNTNAVIYRTELLGDITLSGPGAGRLETGYAIIEDLLAIHKTNHSKENKL